MILVYRKLGHTKNRMLFSGREIEERTGSSTERTMATGRFGGGEEENRGSKGTEGNGVGVNLTSGRIEEMGGCKCTYNKCKDRGK